MAFTEDQVSRYVDSEGTRCPYCKAEAVEADPNSEMVLDVGCGACGREWVEHYELCGISELPQPA